MNRPGGATVQQSFFAFRREYMCLKIPEMACSALTHMAVLFAVTAAPEKEHQKIRPPNEQRDKRFRRHQNGSQVDQC